MQNNDGGSPVAAPASAAPQPPPGGPAAQAPAGGSADQNVEIGKMEEKSKVAIQKGEANYHFGEGNFFLNIALGRGRRKASNNPLINQIAGALQGLMAEEAAAAPVEPIPSTQAAQLPQTPEALEEWYYEKLTLSERCFVQAAAVLHGAPVYEIAKAGAMLFAPIQKAWLQESLLLGEVEESAATRLVERLVQELLHPPKPEQLYASTHTIIRKINGSPRLYWKDVSPNGTSAFRQRVLHFVAERASSFKDLCMVPPGQSFLDQLRRWPDEFSSESEECSWRAANVLGAIWYMLDTNRLRTQANLWAASSRQSNWRHAAWLLDGAFEMEQGTSGNLSEDKSTSSTVLDIVEEWVEDAYLPSEAGKGCAAADFYGLIGRRTPEIALKGLEHLMELPEGEEQGNRAFLLLIFVVTNYVYLARTGRVREVMEYLAELADRQSHQRNLAEEKKNEQFAELQRRVNLGTVFAAFFVIASYSLSAVEEDTPTSYSPSQPFPERPALPDKQGRDVLLMGLLARHEGHWRFHIARLLCAALLDGEAEGASELLRHWAEIVLQGVPQGHNPAADPAVQTYERFLVDVWGLLRMWCSELRGKGFNKQKEFDGFKDRMRNWQKESGSSKKPGKSPELAARLGELVQRVLPQLYN